MSVVEGILQLNVSPLLLLIEGVGGVVFSVVETLAMAVQPLAPVTTTENDPAVETVMEEVVAPVLQL